MKKYIFIISVLFLTITSSAQQENTDIPALEKKIAQMLQAEQDSRNKLQGLSGEERNSAVKEMLIVDSLNQIFVANMLDTQGWVAGLSHESNLGIFMIIQHASADYMHKYAPIVEQEYKKGTIVPSLYAIFKDRVQMYAGKPQIYGSQTISGGDGNFYVWPIDDVHFVDKRRREMQLMPMENYLRFMLKSQTVIWKTDMTIEEIQTMRKKK